jgi:hypothetical protein
LVEAAVGVVVAGAATGCARPAVVVGASESTAAAGTTVDSVVATVVTADPSFGASVVGGAIGLPNSST